MGKYTQLIGREWVAQPLAKRRDRDNDARKRYKPKIDGLKDDLMKD